MGGAQGHLAHPWEDLSLTVGDLIKLYGMAFGLQPSNPAFEKYDGINMLFRWDQRFNELIFARSVTDLRVGGIRLDRIRDRFEKEPEIGETMFFAMNALSRAFEENVRDAELSEYEEHWHSCDVLSRKHMNVIRYDTDAIAIHPIRINDRDGITFNNLREISFGVDKEGWKIVPPTYFGFLGKNDVLTRAVVKTLALPHTAFAPTLRDIYRQRIMVQAYDAGVPAYILERVVARVMKDPDHLNLTQLKKAVRYDSDIKVISDFVKNELNVMKEAQSIVEKIVTEFSIGLMEGIGSDLIEDERAEIARLRQAYAEHVNHLIGTKHEEFVDKQSKRLGSMQNINSALEGIIVYYDEKKTFYKFVGWFSSYNQIAGVLRYQR